MSKFIPDTQIVHLRAMRRGDIAVAIPSPSTATVGVAKAAAPSPEGLQSITAVAVPSQGTIDGTPSVTLPADGSFPVLDNTATTILSQDSFQLITLSGAGSFPEIFFDIITNIDMPSIELEAGGTFPALTVAHQTSVV